jgi:hypothetical protein
MADQATQEMSPEMGQARDMWLNFAKLMKWSVIIGAVTLALMALFLV